MEVGVRGADRSRPPDSRRDPRTAAVELTVLGSGGFMPFPDAHLPGFLVRVDGSGVLLDAGEGTQTRLVETGHSSAVLNGVFVSHLHGDHVLGLPGVLIRRSREGPPETPLDLFGPAPLRTYLERTRELLGFEFRFPLRFHALEPSLEHRLGTVRLRVAPLRHRTETYGVVLRRVPEKRRFRPGDARRLGVPRGPLWGRLQSGESVTLEDGRTITPEQVSDPPEPGPSVAYVPDTRPVESFPDAFRGVDLLIHEAMFLERDREHAERKGHSTALEAARVARRLGVRRLLLTHPSRRYRDPDVLVEQAREIFPETDRARDGMRVQIE